MPPIVDREEAVFGPGVGVDAHPGQALAGLVAHFVDVRDRVPCPGVAPLQLDRRAALLLRLRVVTRLLQPERMHAEKCVIARDGFAPYWQHPRDAVPQHARVTPEEVDLVPSLQCQRIARIGNADILEHATCCAPAAFREQAHRLDVAALALGGGEIRRRRDAFARHWQRQRLGTEQVQVGLQRMAHHHLWCCGQSRVDAGDRVADVAAELMCGILEVGQAFGIGAGQRKARRIALVHWNSPQAGVGRHSLADDESVVVP